MIAKRLSLRLNFVVLRFLLFFFGAVGSVFFLRAATDGSLASVFGYLEPPQYREVQDSVCNQKVGLVLILTEIQNDSQPKGEKGAPIMDDRGMPW